MKRFVLPVLAAAALLTACGSSGHKVGVSGRPIARVVLPSPTSLRFSEASNRELARRDAEKLIRIVVVPHAARQVAAVPNSAPSWFRVELSASPRGAAVEHRIWVIDKALQGRRPLRPHSREVAASTQVAAQQVD